MACLRSGAAEPFISPRAMLRASTCWSVIAMHPTWPTSLLSGQVFSIAAGFGYRVVMPEGHAISNFDDPWAEGNAP